MINAVSIPTEKEKVMRKRSTWQAPKERMVHRLKGCPGRWSWKVASEAHNKEAFCFPAPVGARTSRISLSQLSSTSFCIPVCQKGKVIIKER